MKYFKLIIINIFILFFQLPSFSQIINIEDKRRTVVDTAGWFGNIDAGLNFVENGRSIFTVQGNLQLERMQYRHLFLSFSNINFIKIEDNAFDNNGVQHFRYNYLINPALTYEAFAQAQYNEQTRIQFRGLLGTGLRIKPFVQEQFYIGLSYMFEYDQVRDTDEIHRDQRWSSYISMAIRPGENIRISSTNYFQPLIDNFGDLRLSSQTSIIIKITERLHFKSGFTISFDSRIPEGVARTVSKFTNGLRWDFK